MDVFTESHLRANIISWIPVKKTDRVCYIGKDTDVIAGRLREMSENVTCTKGQEETHLKFDYVISVGQLRPEEISRCFDWLSEDGILVLAAENAYGIKYFAGAKEIGSGAYFGSVEGRRESQGVTKEELLASFSAAGFAWQRFYYPFPDYHFAMSVYSDDCLPKQGELIDQTGNFDAERLVLFDEAKAMDALVARGKFPEFSSSYLVCAGKSHSNLLVNEKNETILYVKFSNDRGRGHNIRTYLTKSEDGKRHLLKAADSKEAVSQIENLKKTYGTLCRLYEDTRFSINAYLERKDGLEFEFLSGHTMEEELDLLLAEGKLQKAKETIFEVLNEIRSCKTVKEFQMTEEFQEVFGRAELPDGLMAADASDIDLIMSNILTQEDGSWTVIDYEWSFHFPVPLNYILYRNIRYYADTTEERRKLDPGNLCQRAGIKEPELAVYEKMEEAFQNYVLAGHTPLRQLYQEAGKPAYHVTSILHVADGIMRRNALQIYFDRGSGFSEEDTAVYRSKAMDGTYRLEIPIKNDVKGLRIDPGSQACTVEIRRLDFGNGRTPDFICNGHKMGDAMYLFDTEDPNILLTQIPAKDRTLLLDLRIDSMSLAAAEWIAPKIDAKYRLKKILKK